MGNKNIKNLLELMLEHKYLFSCGLCTLALRLHTKNIISYQERCFLLDYIENNKPLNVKTPYYWPICEINPRIEWINKHIKINS